jgi:hypothetical protein
MGVWVYETTKNMILRCMRPLSERDPVVCVTIWEYENQMERDSAVNVTQRTMILVHGTMKHDSAMNETPRELILQCEHSHGT